MMKKLSKIALLVCFVAMTTSAFAQKHEYPRYGFWSNWGVGVFGSFNIQPDATLTNGFSELAWGQGYSLGMGVLLEKPISNVWGVRVRYNHPTFFVGADSIGVVKDTANHKGMDRHSGLTAELTLNLIDAFKGWDPNRKSALYIFAGGGLGFSHNLFRKQKNGLNAGGAGQGFEFVAVMLDGGLGYRYRLCDRSTLFAELEADVTGDAPNFIGNKGVVKFHHMNFLVNFGYIYNLGVTPTDRALAAQRALLTQERFDALNNEAEQLKKDLTEAQSNEKKLEGEVQDLTAENQRIKDEADARTAALNDSIQGVIDQLKADQLNYYAIPFSILYPNDVWHVQDSEFIKLEAIARVMKDNPDVKLTIVGFCDYTASDEYNMKLSEKRAKEVKRLLVKKYGVDEDRLEVDWKGKTIAFGDIKFSLNRRVSFYRIIE
jgi:outer membrane protein OmpA-like peptidoglycan-associated protein